MSLRCSLLGHSYGEAEIEREREEQGSEVVVTVREFEECERCGDRKVVTENKEVTALESPAPDLEAAEEDPAVSPSSRDAGTAPGASAGAGAGTDAGPDTDASGGTSSGVNAGAGAGANSGVGASAGVGTTPDAGVDASGDDAEILTDSSGSSDSSSSADSPSSASADATGGATRSDTAADDFEQSPSAADDDGVILDDDGGSGDDGRTPGEWPDAETTHPAETDESGPGDWPEVGREDEGFDAEPDDGARSDVEFGGGLTPESSQGVADDESEEVEFVNADGDTLEARDGGGNDTELSSGISAGAEAPTFSGPSEDPDVDAEFVCPECDYRETVSGSSLRAGDICPECARGYLAQE
ncbi:DUF7093 family protein [Halorussus caseinilyticus]|uniref:Oxidoreductase n=1 Tax=Halorussus caseinilyticus TaxID=3034025 RepID=A0ABD5WLS0_9EURY|nr:hypothetical protein [Halorussus sp. DT72]